MSTEPTTEPTDHATLEDGFIAIIGMACRLPGAPDIEAFWELLRRGEEAVTELDEAELAALPADLRNDPRHVKASAALFDLDLFDADFFGLSPREAAATDPQQRLLLEVGWEALERAGYPPSSQAAVGVFAGASSSHYRDFLHQDPAIRDAVGGMQLVIGNDKDHLAPRLSYLLDLRGPSVPVQTACSTSLVAVHLACQSLLGHECDLALAGGASAPYPNRMGYVYEEGGVLSPDGHCRAFDASSQGTAQGNGVALVVLKRLAEALADGDHIHAVIRGSAINNDGAAKVGYTAPSVEGQRRVIEEALAMAEVEPAWISYIEAHGTGTSLGDPIEVEALRQAFFGDATTAPEPTCALGSVKTNLGHCDAAAGIVGLLKAVLCLEHQTLVASLNFDKPNPQIDFAQTPFFVNTETRPWTAAPRYAGVSSFGIGGTNAHVVLAQAPPPQPRAGSAAQRDTHLLTLSARSATALDKSRADLRQFLEARPEVDLQDVCYSLTVGRQAFRQRDAIAFASRDELLAGLAQERGATAATDRHEVVFMFPGQGASYDDLGYALYDREKAFRAAVDRCCEILRPLLSRDLRQLLASSDAAGRQQLDRPLYWQPAIFTIDYAFACLWRSWGIEPTAMIGHSLGEIVAAHLAGVLSLEEALRLVVERGRGSEDMPEGAMLAVPMNADEIAPYLNESLALAAVNGPGLVVVSGAPAAIDRLSAELAAAAPIRLGVQRAFHSPQVEPMLATISRLAEGFSLKAPEIPYLSNVTGTWITDAEATDPAYWARHLRQTVRFHDGLSELLDSEDRLLIEVGPGQVLSGLADRAAEAQVAVPSLAKGKVPTAAIVAALGKAWKRGATIDWPSFYSDERRRRVVLPTYPFERKSFWFSSQIALPGLASAKLAAESSLAVKNPASDWFFLPTWKQAPLTRKIAPSKAEPIADDSSCLVFADRQELGKALVSRLTANGQSVVQVVAGSGFEALQEDLFALDPETASDFRALFDTLAERQRLPRRIVYAWQADTATATPAEPLAPQAFSSLIYLAQALASHTTTTETRLMVVTSGAERLLAEPCFAPWRAALLGITEVLPKELPKLICQHLDIDLEADGGLAADVILREMTVEPVAQRVAWRQGRRFLPIFEQVSLQEAAPVSPWRQDGVYLVTHGLQEIGLALAARWTAASAARVVLVDRSFFPARDEWRSWIEEQGPDDFVSRKIARLELLGERIEVRTADVADAAAVERVRQDVEAEHGEIHGVVHLDPATADTGLILGKPERDTAAYLEARIREAQNLAEIFAKDLDFLVFFSSNTAESGGLGQVDTAAAYRFVDRFAQALAEDGWRALAMAWGTRRWQEDSDDAAKASGSFIAEQLREKSERFGMSRDECLEALERALGLDLPRLIVSTRDYAPLLEQQSQFTSDFFQQQMSAAAGDDSTAHVRPALDTPYVDPRNEVEKLMVDGWKKFFGLGEIGVDDSFFELGGHSLLAVQILKQVNDTFSTRLGLADFFDAPTVAGIAAKISGSPIAADEAELDDLLSEIEGLSDEEIEAVLGV